MRKRMLKMKDENLNMITLAGPTAAHRSSVAMKCSIKHVTYTNRARAL